MLPAMVARVGDRDEDQLARRGARREGLLEHTGVLEIAASERRRRHGTPRSRVAVGDFFCRAPRRVAVAST